MLLVGIALGNAQDLEVLTLVIAHLEHADGTRPDVATGEGRLVDDEQRVGVVTVVGAGVVHEPVVEVVENGGREHAIEPEDARLLVELVLVPAPARNLDDDLDPLREAIPDAHAETIAANAATSRSPQRPTPRRAASRGPRAQVSGALGARRPRGPARAQVSGALGARRPRGPARAHFKRARVTARSGQRRDEPHHARASRCRGAPR